MDYLQHILLKYPYFYLEGCPPDAPQKRREINILPLILLVKIKIQLKLVYDYNVSKD